jgi:hypothetical protein
MRSENSWTILRRYSGFCGDHLLVLDTPLGRAMKDRPGSIIKNKGETIIAHFIALDTLRIYRRKIPERRMYPKRPPTRGKKIE